MANTDGSTNSGMNGARQCLTGTWTSGKRDICGGRSRIINMWRDPPYGPDGPVPMTRACRRATTAALGGEGGVRGREERPLDAAD